MYPVVTLGSLVIPTYYLMISLASVLGVAWFLKRTPPKDENLAINTALIGLVAGFVGARLMHVIYEQPMVYLRDLRLVFEVWSGGFVYYGGLIVGLWAAISYLKKRTMTLGPWLDRASLPLGLAYAVGRLGCFFNGCCYGRICEMPWAVKFPSHISFGMALFPRHPTQLYASLFEMIAVVALANCEKRRLFKWRGQLFWTWLSLHAVNRLIMEHWRDDDRGIDILGMSVSTVISLAILAYGVRLIVKKTYLQKQA